MEEYTGLIAEFQPNQIFVFGANSQGWHGKGAAKTAKTKFGAIQGQARGLQGQAYGLITKNLKIGYWDDRRYAKTGPCSVTESEIVDNIKELYQVARTESDLEFLIAYTAGGSNLNGYSDREMAAMFGKAGSIPHNVIFESKFRELF